MSAVAVARRSYWFRKSSKRKRQTTAVTTSPSSSSSSSTASLEKLISNIQKSKQLALANPKQFLVHNNDNTTYDDVKRKLSKKSINSSVSYGFVYDNKLNVDSPFLWDVCFLDNEAFNIARFALSQVSQIKGTTLCLERIVRYQVMHYKGKNHSLMLEVMDEYCKQVVYHVVVHEETSPNRDTSMELYCWSYIRALPVIEADGDASLSDFSTLYTVTLLMVCFCLGSCQKAFECLLEMF